MAREIDADHLIFILTSIGDQISDRYNKTWGGTPESDKSLSALSGSLITIKGTIELVEHMAQNADDERQGLKKKAEEEELNKRKKQFNRFSEIDL